MADTKDRIMMAALELFSEKGYEAVSVGQLAEAVGIKAPSLYKHYASKQDIFDALLVWLNEQYESRSVMALSGGRDRLTEYRRIAEQTPEEYAETLCRQLRLVTGHPVISKTRKLLTTEQFRNPRLAGLLERHQYSDVFEYQRELMRYLIYRGVLRDEDAELMALEFMAPITLEMQRADRDPACTEEAEAWIRRHVIRFFRLYGTTDNTK